MPAQMARRNWLIMGVLVLASLAWRSLPVTLGVLGGALVSIAGFYWLHHSLRRTLEKAEPGAARRFQMRYFVRLAAVAAAIMVLIVPLQANPAALAAGLSVVVLNIIWTTVKRSI